MYNELREQYDILKESTDSTLSANEKVRLQLNAIMTELNAVSGRTIALHNDVENGQAEGRRNTAAQIMESIELIKKKLNEVPTKNADNQMKALIKNLRQTISFNEQEIERLNLIIEEKDNQISNLDTQLNQTHEQLDVALEKMRNAEKTRWMQMGDELMSTADLLPDVKGHGNMKPIKQAKLTIILRAKAAYQQSYELGSLEALAKIEQADKSYKTLQDK